MYFRMTAVWMSQLERVVTLVCLCGLLGNTHGSSIAQACLACQAGHRLVFACQASATGLLPRAMQGLHAKYHGPWPTAWSVSGCLHEHGKRTLGPVGY